MSWKYSWSTLSVRANDKGHRTMKQITVENFVSAIQSGVDIQVIDVRTPDETKLMGFTLPGTLQIPKDQFFRNKDLARIPRNRKVVISCKMGDRGEAVTTALNYLGFHNVYNLKGGLLALMEYLDPDTAARTLTENNRRPTGVIHQRPSLTLEAA